MKKSPHLLVIDTRTQQVVDKLRECSTQDDRFGLDVFLGQYYKYINQQGPKPDYFEDWQCEAPGMLESYPHIAFARVEETA